MSDVIKVGDEVEVELPTGLPPFRGTVLDQTPCPVTYDLKWYKVKPLDERDMPSNFWYKDTEVRKASKKDDQTGE